MTNSEAIRTARLEAVAAIELTLLNRTEDVEQLIKSSDNHEEFISAVVGLAASLMFVMPHEQRDRILDGFRRAAVA
jgi:hypothetical protein